MILILDGDPPRVLENARSVQMFIEPCRSRPVLPWAVTVPPFSRGCARPEGEWFTYEPGLPTLRAHFSCSITDRGSMSSDHRKPRYPFTIETSTGGLYVDTPDMLRSHVVRVVGVSKGYAHTESEMVLLEVLLRKTNGILTPR